ncbi:MAG TPA: cupin domain-containing protein [Thermoanaerobaculia bacterium]|nr:cupin domain-containing protein [Thermoanaerobaculia bacterium]
MRAYRLDNPSDTVALNDLAKQGILSWAVPADEKVRTSTIDRIKRDHGYVDQDFVALTAETPNLDTICAKFDKEHFHTEDEVRFVVEGEGIFDVRDKSDRWIRIEVKEGDILLIPKNTHHRFMLTDRKHIRCMRLFANHDGWAPLYRQTATAAGR